MLCRMFVILVLIAAVLNASILRTKRHRPSEPVPHPQQNLKRRVRYAGTGSYGSCCGASSYNSQGTPNSWITTGYNSYSNNMPSSSHSTSFSQSLAGGSCPRCSPSYFTYSSGSSHTGFGGSDDKSLSTNAKGNLQTSSNSPSSNSWKPSSSCVSCSMGTGSGTPLYVQNTNPSFATSSSFSSSSSSSFSSSSSSSFSSSWSNTYSSDSQSNSGQTGFQSSSAASSQSASSVNEAQTIQSQNNNGNQPLLSTSQNSPNLYSCTTCSGGVGSPISSDVKEIKAISGGSNWGSSEVQPTSCLKCSQGNSDAKNTGSSTGFESGKAENKFDSADSKSETTDNVSSSYARPAIIFAQKDAVESEPEKEVPMPPTDEELIATSCTMCSQPNTGYYSDMEVPTSASSLSCAICSQKGTISNDFAPSVDYKIEATRAVPQTEVDPSAKKWEYFYDKYKAFSRAMRKSK